MKCDEVKPVCGPCAKGHRPCVYSASVKVRVSLFRPVIRSAILPPPPQVRWDPVRDEPRNYESHAPAQPSPGTGLSLPPWSTPQEDSTSPRSTLSSTPYPAEIAPLRWLGLLADDAGSVTSIGPSERSHEADDYNLSLSAARFSPVRALGVPGAHDVQTRSRSPYYSSAPISDPATQAAERRFWQAHIKLRPHEMSMFRHFVERLSNCLDMYDPLKHFSTFVPQLALNNEGLMKSIMALSARHLSIKDKSESTPDRTAAVQYYYETLQYLQGAMHYDSFKTSLELLATTIIISSYEMIDGAGSGWERHLKGTFWIQRSQEINGQSGGLKQAVWWCWLRQDVWAAFRERRRCFSFYKPTKPYHVLDQYDIASRAIYLLAQAVNYASDKDRKLGETNLQSRIERADTLFNMLDEWQMNLTPHFTPLPIVDLAPNGPFKPIWINPPCFATAVQMHYFARILLLVHQPAAGGYREYLLRDKSLNEAIDTIGGLATAITCESASLHSSQCLFAAGLYTQDLQKREKIVELIKANQFRTGWPSTTDLTEELRQEWSKSGPP
ncbi:uncharacterized protein K452DRAFT_276488 [Aplosporella prunicola CBS 121167]|uniref:Zn(2)-C6 fungal-type domain-containing protein n=1 Tax=Aplosporella prunicola CBS 121167 TaxID=1176127 RepID=A0A6A6B3W4_9PEZI|nr:uncharacterized protein K452DRAFT_276488 [Aplosporella prunicola CBS 121167]KAF2138750.1 hypothetical protein K452DRAFT_276488 [Aplosporella prunicola CBS 121167]